MPMAKPEVSFETANEWLKHSKTKQALVEQIYQRPGWRHMLKVTNSVDLRQKMKGFSNLELAELLVKLDHS